MKGGGSIKGNPTAITRLEPTNPMKQMLIHTIRWMAMSLGLAGASANAQYVWPGTAQVMNESSTQFYQFNLSVTLYYFEDGVYRSASTDLREMLYPSQTKDFEQQAILNIWGYNPAPIISSASAYVYGDFHYQLPMTAPASASVSIPYGTTSWKPSFSGGSGALQNVWCVAGYTNWNWNGWTPPARGTYSFYVGGLPLPGYVGNVNDPLIGNMQVNYTTYTVTVY